MVATVLYSHIHELIYENLITNIRNHSYTNTILPQKLALSTYRYYQTSMQLNDQCNLSMMGSNITYI